MPRSTKSHPADGDQRPDRLRNIVDAPSTAWSRRCGIMITGRQQHHLRLGRPHERAQAPQRDGRNRLRQRREDALRAARTPGFRAARRRLRPTAAPGRPLPVCGLTLIQSDRRAIRPPETGRSDQRHSQQPQNRRHDVALRRGHDAQRQPADGQNQIHEPGGLLPGAPTLAVSLLRGSSSCFLRRLPAFDARTPPRSNSRD